ncbi:hypothetical protein AB8U03_13860 [Clostridium sp. Mt-5]|uniref:Uncharacterized protein n=1 Tax=Clostridium moutaii TaxID=3240932 RepID=A0ABV4BRY4_9CLOT
MRSANFIVDYPTNLSLFIDSNNAGIIEITINPMDHQNATSYALATA